MDPHPDFASADIPARATLDGFWLTPLDTGAVEEDFEVVSASRGVLVGLFGDTWPDGLTIEANAVDLAWHEREFSARRSFAWIIRDATGAYLGCAYLYPDLGVRAQGKIVTWIRDRPDRLTALAAFNRTFRDWIAAWLPAGGAYVWLSNDRAG